jgi:hypothetical protein
MSVEINLKTAYRINFTCGYMDILLLDMDVGGNEYGTQCMYMTIDKKIYEGNKNSTLTSAKIGKIEWRFIYFSYFQNLNQELDYIKNAKRFYRVLKDG